MPQGITFRTGVTFGDTTLPILPYSLTGSPEVRARFLATTGTTNDAGVSSWTSLDGGVTMSPIGGSAPAKSTATGYTVARFNGTSSQLQADLAQSRPHAFAVAFYVHTVPPIGTTAVIVGGQSNTSSDPAVGDSGMLTMGGPSWNIHGGTNGAAGTATTGWHTAVVSFGATNTTALIDGASTTRDVGQVPRKIITLGGHRGAYYAHISVAELVVWDSALTSTQMDTVQSSMRSHYGL